MAERTCIIDGCGNKHRAKGYCSTHYNRVVMTLDVVHPKVSKPCVACGEQVARRDDPRRRTTCSVECRTAVTWGHRIAQADAYDWQRDAIKRALRYGARIVDKFDREEIFERDDWTCQGCGVRCDEPDPYNLRAATVDHVIALTLGGEHSRANAQTLCLSCNSAKQSGIAPAA